VKEAMLYEKLDRNRVRCGLCAHTCLIKESGKGICGVRENREGTLVSLVYGRLIAEHQDPIEKKPLFHFLPGTASYSIATAGCNFRCRFCQNAEISQMPAERHTILGAYTSAEEIVDRAVRSGCASISYTYTEPTVYAELALDTSRLAVERGLKNVFVTNGYMSEACLDLFTPYLHAANVDLKAFSEAFYKEQCGARLEPVLQSIARMKERGIWVEVTTLIIPGLNDSDEELRRIASFIAGLDPGIPWHVSRFHPAYRMVDRGATPPERVRRARDIGRGVGLQYVYTGNLPGDAGELTVCHACGADLIGRFGFHVTGNRIREGACPQCRSRIPGVWAP